jgi:hypothetical protein
VQESIKLAAHGVNDSGSAVSSVETANASREIDQPVAIHVFDDGTFCLRNEHRCGMMGSPHDCGIAPLH